MQNIDLQRTIYRVKIYLTYFLSFVNFVFINSLILVLNLINHKNYRP